MPRTARRKSSTGIYHIILRGINRQRIFEDDEDNEKYLQTLAECKKISLFQLYGYCLMGNHVHLLIKEGKEGIEQIFRRVGARYVYWYNWKYKRSGHLFQDRFKSEAIENDGYFITALRYIHQNPVKARISNTLEGYRWSSYNEYVGRTGVADIHFALELMGEETFFAYMNEKNEDSMLEIEDEKHRLTDKELSDKICKEINIKPIMIQNFEKEDRDRLLRQILKYEGISSRQLARVTGISANIIWKIASK
jgi:REP element-mobilizing transposase RayT